MVVVVEIIVKPQQEHQQSYSKSWSCYSVPTVEQVLSFLWSCIMWQTGCGTGGGKDFLSKKDYHKDEATFTNKMGGTTRRDNLWNLWFEPETNKEISVLPAGAKIQKWLCWRELSKDKNTDKT